MKRHVQYLKYIIRHKWFVFLACRKCGVSLWRSLIHDWTKFLPCEWFPYVDEFYGDWKKLKETEPDDFRYWQARIPVQQSFHRAWNHHQKHNKHHWQYWLLTNDNDEPKHEPLDMPEKYMREMVADWWGAGRAITGEWKAHQWYKSNSSQILISSKTRQNVEDLLGSTQNCFQTPEFLAQRIRILGY